jgi:putative aminopeptidase FrvX
MRSPLPFAILFATLLVPSHRAAAQPRPDDAALARTLTSWIALPVAPGREREVAAQLARMLPGWTADGMGNVVRRTGSGSPRRVVACALDIPQYVVSQVTEDGFLRLHRAGNAFARHPLWDQFHEAQRIKVLTRTAERAGVVAVANGHFSRQHRADTTVTWVDELWVDVGASSAREVRELGIELLDPVLADRPAWEYQGLAAGPAAGARASCAAVATAAQSMPSQGETIWVLATGRAFGWTGLGGALARLGRVDQLTLVDAGRASARDTSMAAARVPASAVARVAATSTIENARLIAPRVRFGGSFVESVAASDARALLAAVADAGGVSLGEATWPAMPLDTARVLAPRTDRHGDAERTFFTLADLPGAPGHEWQVREAILRELPAWARDVAVVDTAGNLIVAIGPERDSVLFIAHMDEVAFEVRGISRDGVVTLAGRGGSVASTWEGQTAMIHFDRPASGTPTSPLRGVFIPRDTAAVKAPRAMSAWFGLDSAGLVARGVRVGQGVTSYKRGGRLAGTRITGRGSDDRTGSTALVHAVRGISPSAVKRRVIFAWSTREEVGLNGARAIAATHGTSLKRVYSVDTFVSSETPLELPTFAFTRLGAGPVLRGLDDGAMSPVEEMERVQRIARANRIPLQVGTTHGATDGSAITPYGASNVGLSWPGRYSHSPGEVLDLRDLDGLIKLVRAMALEP